jgi:hypothetical protein
MCLNNSVINKTAAIAAAVIILATNPAGAVPGTNVPYTSSVVNNETLEDVAKYYFYDNSRLASDQSWDDLQVLIVPEKTLTGDIYGYYGVIYFGEGRIPTLAQLLDWSRISYEARNKMNEVENGTFGAQNKSKVTKLEEEASLAYGYDVKTAHFVFWYSYFGVTQSGPAFMAGGDGIPDDISGMYKARLLIEENYAVKDLSFIGFVTSRMGNLAEFAGSDDTRYYGTTAGVLNHAYTKSNLNETNEETPGEWKYVINGPDFTWQEFREEVDAIKKGGWSEGNGALDVEGHGMYVPNYAQNDVQAPQEPGDGNHWGCGPVTIASVVMYEKYRWSERFPEEYWEYTPSVQGEYRDQDTGRDVLGGMNGIGSPCPRGIKAIYTDGVAHFAYMADPARGPWGLDYNHVDDVINQWFGVHFKGEDDFYAVCYGWVDHLAQGDTWHSLARYVEIQSQAVPLSFYWLSSSTLHCSTVYWLDYGDHKIFFYDGQPNAPIQEERECKLDRWKWGDEGAFSYIRDFPDAPAPAPFFEYAIFEPQEDGILLSWAVNDMNVERFEILNRCSEDANDIKIVIPAAQNGVRKYSCFIRLGTEEDLGLYIKTVLPDGATFKQALVKKGSPVGLGNWEVE